jgi:hypothetical protein
MKLFIAPPIDDLKQIALDAVDAWAAAQRARPAAQASMDAFKLTEADKVLAGGSSRLIEEEADIHGISPKAQAEAVVAAASATVDLELARVVAKAAIRKARKHTEVMKILQERDIRLNTGPQLGL